MKNLSKTKILYIGPIPPEVGGKSTGGIATHCWELATQAFKRGYDVYVLAENATASFTKDGIKVISPPHGNKLVKAFYGVRSYLVNRNKLEELNFLTLKERVVMCYIAHRLKRVLKVINPDLIHVHSLVNTASLSLSIAQSRVPLVISDHGIGVYEFGMRKIYKCKTFDYLRRKVRETSKRADYIISVSEFSKDQLLASHMIDNPRIKAILNPLNIDKLPMLNRRQVKQELGLSDKKIILFSGVSEPIKKKKLDILLKSLAIDDYLRANCKLLVVTQGKAITFAHDFVKNEDIDALIFGPQPWDKLITFYNASDVFVMPSRVEGIGLVYEEALAVGVPVVGFPESLKELENLLGVYIGEKFDVSNEDEKALAEKIIKVLNTNFDRELMRRKVIENLSWDAKFSEFDSVYKEVLRE